MLAGNTMLSIHQMLFFLFTINYIAAWDTRPPDQVIRDNGYPVEKHWTRTEDGYWLRLHRIPHGKNEVPKNQTKEVFFLQHGLTASSSHFVFNKECLAFTLADEGYDVWLGNTRGSVYSRYHAFHSNESDEYWDFSFDEMAKYDLPAMINYALANATQENLWYVGHSQGTMIMFAKLSDDPDFQDKIKGFFALAPVAKLDTIFAPIRVGSRIFYGLKWVLDSIHLMRLPLPYHLLIKVIRALCILDKKFCGIAYAELQKYDIKYIDWEKLPEVLSDLFTEGDACIKNIYHYCQLIASGKFQKYDYGKLGNLLWYWSLKPPEYDMYNIATAVWLFSGSIDVLSSVEDVKWINEQLADNVQGNFVHKGYSHGDFLWGKTVKNDIYDKIIGFARNFTAIG